MSSDPDNGGFRVVHLVTSDAYAGLERHVLQLARELSKLGCDSSIACPPSAARLRAEADAAGLRLLPANNASPRAWLFGVRRTLRLSPPDVIHVHDGRAALAATGLGLARLGLYVRTQHFTRPASVERDGWRGTASLALQRKLNRRLDGYVAVSRAVAGEARKRKEIGRAELAVIAPGIEMASEDVVDRARAARKAASVPVIAYVGRLEDEKCLDTLVRAAPLVRRRVPDCRFVIAGAGAAEHRLRALADEVGASDSISWPGWVKDSGEVLAHAHVYVNTWPWEGYGMAMAEALSYGLPVVAVNSGAAPELVDDGVTGRLAPVGDPEALAGVIGDLASDPASAERMGEMGRRRAIEGFGADRTAVRISAFYRQLSTTRQRG